MFEFLLDAENYDQRKVGRDISKSGITVSTAFTSDEGYETALIDKNEVHPVERYADKKAAKIGHKKWVAFADNAVSGTPVIKLGAWGLVDEEEIILEI